MINAKHHIIHFRLTQLFALLLPINPTWSAACILLISINWIIGLGFKGALMPYFKLIPFTLFVSFYILYALGLFWSHNIQSGEFEVITKLSLILMPLVYFSVPLKSDQFRKTIHSFILGCAIAMSGLLLIAAYRFFITKYYISQGQEIWDFGINYFLKDRLSFIVHPSYMAMFLCTAIWMNYKISPPIFRNSYLKIGLLILFILSLILLISKAGILVLLLIGAYYLYELIFKQRKLKQAVSILVLFCLTFGSIFYNVPQFKIRFTSAISAFYSKNTYNSDDSTGSRIAVWEASKDIIASNFLIGTGTGSANDVLMEHYKTNKMSVAYNEHLNAHNQYLQTFITLGLLGILSLIIMLLFPLRIAILENNLIYSGFLIIFILNIFVESMLETQSGNLFYAFFNALLFMNSVQNQKL